MPIASTRIVVLHSGASAWRVAVNDVLTTRRFRSPVTAAEYAGAIQWGEVEPDFDEGGRSRRRHLFKRAKAAFARIEALHREVRTCLEEFKLVRAQFGPGSAEWQRMNAHCLQLERQWRDAHQDFKRAIDAFALAVERLADVEPGPRAARSDRFTARLRPRS
jgi:hypothetical protein